MDQALLHLINQQWTNPALDLFMAAISNIEIWKPLFVLVALLLLIFGGFKGRAFLLCLLLCLAVAEPVTNFLKMAVQRHRPKQVQVVRMVQLQRTRPAFMAFSKNRLSAIRTGGTGTARARPFHPDI